jgi:hypothetical protein
MEFLGKHTNIFNVFSLLEKFERTTKLRTIAQAWKQKLGQKFLGFKRNEIAHQMTKNSLLLRLSLSRRMASLYISKSRLASDALYLYRTSLDFLRFMFFRFMV